MKTQYKYHYSPYLKAFLIIFLLINILGIVLTALQLMQLFHLYVNPVYGACKLVLHFGAAAFAVAFLCLRYVLGDKLQLSVFGLDLNRMKFKVENLVSIIVENTSGKPTLYCGFVFSTTHERIVLVNISPFSFDGFISAVKEINPKVIVSHKNGSEK